MSKKNYLSLEVLLSQDGTTNPPTIEIVENCTGLVFSTSYIDDGNYDLNASRQIFDNHTVLNFSQVCDAGTINDYPEIRAFVNDSESIKIITTKIIDEVRARADGILKSTPFKIEIPIQLAMLPI